MKTIGLIGGVTWHSTLVYYRNINQLISERLVGNHSAKLILHSIDYDDFKQLQEMNDWHQIELMLSTIARQLENAGADCVLICSNTPHMIADTLKQKINIPFLHIAEETAKEIVYHNINKVGLLGTKFTMENSFFIDRLSAKGIETIVPENTHRDFIHQTIHAELSKGVFNNETKVKYLEIIEWLAKNGAQAIILGCTEIGLLVNQSDCETKLFDTTVIHAKAAADFALS